MITSEMLEQTPGTWYIEAGLFNSTWEPGLTLNISTFLSKCLYWHIAREMWTTEGCQVSFHMDKVLLNMAVLLLPRMYMHSYVFAAIANQ